MDFINLGSPETPAQKAKSRESSASGGFRSTVILGAPERQILQESGNLRRLVADRQYFGLDAQTVGSSRVDLQACKLEYSIVSPK